jgi:hypothetical protein
VLNAQAMGAAQQLQLQRTGVSQIANNELTALQAKQQQQRLVQEQQRMRLQQTNGGGAAAAGTNGGAGSQLQQRAAQAAQVSAYACDVPCMVALWAC